MPSTAEKLHLAEDEPCLTYIAGHNVGPDNEPYCWMCGWSKRSHRA